jgi:hypothetical protein
MWRGDVRLSMSVPAPFVWRCLSSKGRPSSIDATMVAALKAEGLGATAIANRLKVGRASVYRMLAS